MAIEVFIEIGMGTGVDKARDRQGDEDTAEDIGRDGLADTPGADFSRFISSD